MGLWIKNADGTIERTAGGGADGQPGVDGNMWHVGSGAPASTLGEPGDYYLDGEDGWVYVKRTASSWTNLFVNLTGPPGSGGGGDFLPLSGGTVTGNLQVDGMFDAPAAVLTGDGQTLSLMNATPSGQPHIGFYHNGIRRGYIGNVTATTTELSADLNQLLLGGAGVRVVHTNLQVDGTIKAAGGSSDSPALTFANSSSGVYGNSGSVVTAVDGAWQQIVYKDLIRLKKDLQVDGQIKAPNGTAAAPAYSFTSDTKSGFSVIGAGPWPSNAVVSVVANGTSAANFGDKGASLPPVYGNTTANRPNVYIAADGGLYRSTTTRSDSDDIRRLETIIDKLSARIETLEGAMLSKGGL